MVYLSVFATLEVFTIMSNKESRKKVLEVVKEICELMELQITITSNYAEYLDNGYYNEEENVKWLTDRLNIEIGVNNDDFNKMFTVDCYVWGKIVCKYGFSLVSSEFMRRFSEMMEIELERAKKKVQAKRRFELVYV